MYQLTESELDTLHTAGNIKTLDIALFSLSAGILAALVVTLLTIDLKALNEQASFIASTWVFGLATIFFGVRSLLAWRSARAELRRIKEPKVST